MTVHRAGRPFLDPALLARIGDLAARWPGWSSRLHPRAASVAPRSALSIDFAEHRPYQPGDDIRRIDWRVYGRTERYYIKSTRPTPTPT